MKKYTFCLCIIISSFINLYAQYSFPINSGPINVAEGSPVTLDLNDIENSAVVTNNLYLSLRVITDWMPNVGAPSTGEASIEVTTTSGTVVVLSPQSVVEDSCCPLSLSFFAVLPANYIPLSDGFLNVVLKQTGVGTSANWSNIDIDLLVCTMPVATTTIIEDCDNDQFSVDVNVTDLGSLPPASLDDFGGGFISINNVGIYRMGPYSTDFPVLIQVTGDATHGCSYMLQSSIDCDLLNTDYVAFKGFKYFPNPVKNILELNAQNEISTVAVYNTIGKEVLTIRPENFEAKVDMSDMQSGIYFIKVMINSTIKNIRIIKE